MLLKCVLAIVLNNIKRHTLAKTVTTVKIMTKQTRLKDVLFEIEVTFKDQFLIHYQTSWRNMVINTMRTEDKLLRCIALSTVISISVFTFHFN